MRLQPGLPVSHELPDRVDEVLIVFGTVDHEKILLRDASPGNA
jgi:hypothetical protein